MRILGLHLGKISTSPIEIPTNAPDTPPHKKQKKVKFRNSPRSPHENTSTTVKIAIANTKTYEIELTDPKALEQNYEDLSKCKTRHVKSRHTRQTGHPKSVKTNKSYRTCLRDNP